MKLLVFGDVHGRVPEKPVATEVDAILATGDICGEDADARGKMFRSMETDKEWYELMGEERARTVVDESVEQGRRVLAFLNELGPQVYLVPGNWDWTGRIYDSWGYVQDNTFQQLVDGFDNVCNVNMQRNAINEEYAVIGYGPYSGPELPQYEDDERDDGNELAAMKEEYAKTKNKLSDLFDTEKAVIFLSHNVPLNTKLDKIDNPGSPVHRRHYGSLIVRELIEERGPTLSIAGHMHEGYGKQHIGETLAVNAGIHAQVTAEREHGPWTVQFKPPVSEYSD